MSSDNDLSSTKAAPVKHGKLSIHSEDQSSTHSTYFAAKSTKKSNLPSEDNASEDVVLVSPGTLAKRKNVSDELFPIDEDAHQSKKSRQVIPTSPQSRPSPASDSSTTARTSNLQPPPHQSYSPYPPPSAPWPSAAPPNHHPDGIPGAHPSAHGYLGYRHHYPPPPPNSTQRNTDNHPPNSPVLAPHGSGAPHQHGFGGEYPAWRMPSNQYMYPERHADLPDQYSYAERRPGPILYGHAGYDHLGPYHDSAYNRNPYGYSLGTHPPPPTLHASRLGLGANIPPERADNNPPANANKPGPSGVDNEDGRTKEG